jgi:colicin import membrane protein
MLKNLILAIGVSLPVHVASSEPIESRQKTEEAALRELLNSGKKRPVVANSLIDSEVTELATLIQQRISTRWVRPKSARNGMEVTLSISLDPSGEVVDIDVRLSSGSTAFDQSAVRAVQEVARIPEIAALSPAIYEKYFRQLRLLFRPEDLKR